MPGFRKKAGRKFLLQQHMAAGERIERGGTKRIAELFHVKHRRGSVCVNVSRETVGIVARCAGDDRFLKRWKVFAHCMGGSYDCTPHFFFLGRNTLFLQPPLLFLVLRKRRAPCGCRRKRGPSAFGLSRNPDRCSASFVHIPLLLRAPPESCCGSEKPCVYPLAPEWSEPLRFCKGNAFEKQGCRVIESTSSL